MTHQVHRREDHRVMPWANGGGTTREVARENGPDGSDGFGWRLSFADVTTSGPFSPLPGVDRVITLVEGVAMTLEVEGATHVLHPFAPCRFAGEDRVHCTPDGATVDFNVMTRRGRWTAAIECCEVGGPTVLEEPDPSTVRFVAVLDGGPEITDEPQALRRYDVVRPGPGRLHLRGPGRIAVVDLRPAHS